MIARFINTSNWTYEQWLAAIILVFIVLTVIVFLYRMVKLFRAFNKPAYQPNLRPLRRRRISTTNSEHKPNTNDN